MWALQVVVGSLWREWLVLKVWVVWPILGPDPPPLEATKKIP